MALILRRKFFWTSLDKFGQVWASLDKFGQVWTSLDESGQVWMSELMALILSRKGKLFLSYRHNGGDMEAMCFGTFLGYC